jgi:hypothetical protein
LASNCGDTYEDLIIAHVRSELGFDVCGNLPSKSSKLVKAKNVPYININPTDHGVHNSG